jgi:hypothetical protein
MTPPEEYAADMIKCEGYASARRAARACYLTATRAGRLVDAQFWVSVLGFLRPCYTALVAAKGL